MLTMSSPDKGKKGQRKSVFCGYFMAEWDDHHYCPKCRDDCTICSTFSKEQRKKVRNRDRYKNKKDQNSSVFVDNGNKDCSIDDSLLDEEESAVYVSSQVLSSQKNSILEDKLDRFFTEFASLSQRLQNLEQKGAETAGSRTNSGRDSFHFVKQSVERTKTPASSVASAVAPSRLDRLAIITRAESEQQASVSQIQDESGDLGASSRNRTFSQSSEEPDPDLEQGEFALEGRIHQLIQIR